MILDFLRALKWIDGRELLPTVEPYRRAIFEAAFSIDGQGQPRFSLVLTGRAKKNWKSADLVLAALYSLVLVNAPQGAGGYILANDLEQADDDLALAKLLIGANPEILGDLLAPKAKAIVRKDGKGELEILPARDVAGAHGKTAAFLGYDEIHAYRDYALLEALSPDPTRADVLTWVATYDSLWHAPGKPLWDMFLRGRRGEDPRMLFSWYSGDFCTDSAFEKLEPERRANPSMAAWTNQRYLIEQKLRLPSHKYRRLHLNIGGQPEGAAFDASSILACVAEKRTALPARPGVRYAAFVDMSGGSSDDAVLAIAHVEEGGRRVLDLVISQTGPAPFNPRDAVRKFAAAMKEYRCSIVVGDAYAGETFRRDFDDEEITYRKSSRTKSELYEALEPKLNAGAVELLDDPKLLEQFQGLVMRGAKIDSAPGEHEDFANAAAGALVEALGDAIDLGFPVPDAWRPSAWRESLPPDHAGRGYLPEGYDEDAGSTRQHQARPFSFRN